MLARWVFPRKGAACVVRICKDTSFSWTAIVQEVEGDACIVAYPEGWTETFSRRQFRKRCEMEVELSGGLSALSYDVLATVFLHCDLQTLICLCCTGQCYMSWVRLHFAYHIRVRPVVEEGAAVSASLVRLEKRVWLLNTERAWGASELPGAWAFCDAHCMAASYDGRRLVIVADDESGDVFLQILALFEKGRISRRWELVGTKEVRDEYIVAMAVRGDYALAGTYAGHVACYCLPSFRRKRDIPLAWQHPRQYCCISEVQCPPPECFPRSNHVFAVTHRDAALVLHEWSRTRRLVKMVSHTLRRGFPFGERPEGNFCLFAGPRNVVASAGCAVDVFRVDWCNIKAPGAWYRVHLPYMACGVLICNNVLWASDLTKLFAFPGVEESLAKGWSGGLASSRLSVHMASFGVGRMVIHDGVLTAAGAHSLHAASELVLPFAA